MSNTSAADEPLISLLQRTFPSALSAIEAGNDYPNSKIIKAVYPEIEYSETEKAEISQWLITSHHVASPTEDVAKTAERLSSLNTHLSTRTTLLGHKPSVADLALYARLAPVVASWTRSQRTGQQGYHHIVRHLQFVQNAPLFKLQIEEADKIQIDEDDIETPVEPIDPKIEKERKKKEKEAAAAVAAAATASGVNGTEMTLTADQTKGGQGGRKAKKETKSTGDVVVAAVGAETAGVAQPSAGTKREKKSKKAPEPAKETALSPCLIDLRVGHILKAEQHPNADSLYVSTIACGDPPGTENTSEYEGQVVRTVCSGLNGLVPLDEMQGRNIVAVCNLKPVTMRGIKSAAMVLAASPRLEEGEVDNHRGPVELVNPPEGAQAGERVYFEGWQGEPEAVLNPKKKIWETCQVGFTTTEMCEVGFDASAVKELEGVTGVAKLRTKDGLCAVRSLKGATVR